MLIKCPKCGTSAKIADSKEGAKVRCSSCERIYVARHKGERGQRAKSGIPPAAIIGGGVLLAAVALMVVVKKSDPKDSQASEPKVQAPEVAPAAPVVKIDPYSFDGEVTQFCVELHRLSFESDRGVLGFHLSGDHLLAAEKEGIEASDAPFSVLANVNQRSHLNRWAEDLITGPSSQFIKQWEPYDSDVTQVNGQTARIELSVSARAEGDSSQHVVIWNLVKAGEEWKVAGWELFKPKSGKRTESYASSSNTVAKVELEDGSIVMEREAEALPHLEDTSEELRARIDTLYATMVDLDLTREANKARNEIIAIGKPVIPILLTGLYETRLDTEEECIKANIIVVALREITGQSKGYQPMSQSGSRDTEEYRQSAVRQWFAWWYRFGPKFLEKRESKDALEDFIQPTEEEQRAARRDRK